MATSKKTIDFTGSIIESVGGDAVQSSSSTDNTETTSKIRADDDDLEAASVQEAPTVTVVTDLQVYQGNSLPEQVESFIAAHSVVMFYKTWCLFSLDAQSFLTEQLGVSLHVIELDEHLQGKIKKY